MKNFGRPEPPQRTFLIPIFPPVPKSVFPVSLLTSDTLAAARSLLGAVLEHRSPEGVTAGRIVETEAYLQGDPACHANRGETPRTKVMFGPPGRAYVYLIYGMHQCFNVVTRPAGTGEAVLIRALEPLAGLDLMRLRRGSTIKDMNLCNGPAKLVQAMGLGAGHYGANLIGSGAGSGGGSGARGALRLLAADSYPGGMPAAPLIAGPRVGISVAADLPYRFYFKGNRYVSKPWA
jgi:DNA-3-methyladenine glycosylase